MAIVPQGVSPTDFAEALRQFEGAVGKEWTFTKDEDVDLYRDAYSPFWGEEEERRASAAVAPASVEQVQALMRIANKYKVPMYPVSTGRNLGYGGSAPNHTGSVVLDLKRMNRVLDVNEGNAYALVEPGVSYFDLYRHIEERKLKVWLDVPDPGWGSPVGNSMDRGGGYTMPQFRNHFDAHCGLEVVLANGELLRTGMGAMPNARSWQEFKAGFGPWIDGIFSQSNFGVVTKMGFWLMPQPEAHFSGTVTMFHHADLIPFVDIMNYLENTNVFNGMTFMGSPLLGGVLPGEANRAIDAELGALITKPGGPSAQELEAYCRKVKLGLWSAKFNFYGPEEVVRAQWNYCRKRFSAAIRDVQFEEGELLAMPLTPA